MTKTNKSVEGVLTELRTGIQRGRYAPGQRLITSELADQMRTSLAPVREALHILAGEGLVNIRPNRGASVITLNPQTLIDGLQILGSIGALALQLVGPKLSDSKLQAEISRLSVLIKSAGKRRAPHDFFTAIAASYRVINDFSGNSYLNPILNRVHLEYFYRQMADYLPDDFWDRYIENYEHMAKFLHKEDIRGAQRALSQHISWVIGLLRKRL